eukprot:jgi/Galph1/5363/GphlegSOOS_G4039.1
MPNNVKEEWITVPPHCQVVVCSTETLKEFLGGQVDENLQRMKNRFQTCCQIHFYICYNVCLTVFLYRSSNRSDSSQRQAQNYFQIPTQCNDSLVSSWDDSDVYVSVVVDRELDVDTVTKQLYQLHNNRRQLQRQSKSLNYRLTICFAPHLFGSGKTTFCLNYLELVRNFSETVLATYHMEESKRTFLENLKNAALLYVDLSKLEPMIPFEEKRNFKWAIYYLLVKTACSQAGSSLISKESAYRAIDMEASNLVPLLRGILSTRVDQFLLITFDEVGALEGMTKDFDFKETSDGRVRPYNDFFGILRELCEQENLFFIVVGKSKGLSIQNHVSSVSKVLLHFISLSPLDSPSIKEHLVKSHLKSNNRLSVYQVLCCSSFSVDELADVFLEYTGGVPGLLTRAVNMLLNYSQSIQRPLSKEECIACLKNDQFQTICSEPFQERLVSLDEGRRRLLDILLIMALYRIPFTKSSKLNNVFLYDAVTEMGLYRRPVDSRTYEVLLPKVFVFDIEDNVSLSSLEKILLDSIRDEPMDCFLYSKGRVFEGLVAIRLDLMLSSELEKVYFRDLLAQLSSVWSQMKLPFDMPSPLCYMNSVGDTEWNPESRTMRRTFGKNEWNKIIRDVLALERIYIPKEPNSHSPDILFKLQSKRQSPGELRNLIVGVACKGRWKSEGIGWSDVVKEAEKFLVPVYEQVLCNSLNTNYCMLIILSNKLSMKVASDLNNQSRCYSGGMYIHGSFQIPPNCELVVLCEKDVEILVDKQILSGLERAFHIHNVPTLGHFSAPLVSRKEAVVQVLRAFRGSFEYMNGDPMEAGNPRPVICFAGHMHGSGKTTFGMHFHEFLVMNREFVKNQRVDILLPGSPTLEDGLNALCDETIYVYLDLREFPTEGEYFDIVLYERICKYALSGYPNKEELLGQVGPPISQCVSKWLKKLLQVTKKKYLFVCIDEIGCLGEPNMYVFFLLRPLLCIPRVLCLVTGRTGHIIQQVDDAGASRLRLKLLKLDPFSLEATHAFIQHAMYKNISFQNILFPGNPQGMDYFSRIVWEYTSGVPIHVRHVLSRLAENRLSNLEWKDLSEAELRKKVETIVPEWRLFVDPLHRRSDTIGVFSSLLFANVFEIPVEVGKTYFECSKLGACYVDYALDVASNFGLYYSQGDRKDT